MVGQVPAFANAVESCLMSRPARRRVRVATPFAPLLVVLLASPRPAGSAELRPYHELAPDRPVLAVTPGLVDVDFANLLDRLEAAGCHIPVAVVGAGIVVVDEPGVDAALAREHAVAGVLRDPAPELARTGDARAQGLMRWWNDGFDVPRLAPEDPNARHDVTMCGGARALRDVLAEQGDAGLRCAAAEYGRTHFIQGRSIVNLVRPESEGSVTDWQTEYITETLAQLTRACNWWSLKSGRSGSFVIVDHGLASTDTEPGVNPSLGDELGYIKDCMVDLGFTDPCGYVALDEFNEAMKAVYHGHWSWTQFILNANGFAGGSILAYAYLGGPHTVATRGNGSLGLAQLARVIAHEMGHIYQALDEYDGGCGCGERAGYLEIPNDNCVYCDRQVGRCVMRGGGEYTAEEAAQMETVIEPCKFTKGMAGLWDADRDGLADVLSTYPDTRIATVFADTLDTSLNLSVVGEAWDVPYPAPARYGEPQTINTIHAVEYSIDNGQWRSAAPLDGLFTNRREEYLLRLPELGGGTHRLRVRGVNTVAHFDRSPPEAPFFVHDVKLRDELAIQPAPRGFALLWQVDGVDFGGTYRILRSLDGAEEVLVAQKASLGGRNDRHRFIDEDVLPGHSYRYRLQVDIPNRWIKELSMASATAVLPEPPAGTTVAVAPNPSPGEFLFTVLVPRGPRPGVGDVVLPPGAAPAATSGSPGLRGPGDPDDPRNPFTPLYRDVRMAVYDVQGRLVRDLGTFRQLETERFNLAWNGRDADGVALPSGVYFLAVRLDYATDVVKVTLVR